MPNIQIKLDADGEYPECKELGEVSSIGLLAHGMKSGKGSVVVEITFPDGRKIYGQTSVDLLHSAASAVHARDEMNRQQKARGH